MCLGVICDYLRENRLFYTYDNNNNGRSHGNKGNKGNSLEFIAHVILEKQSGNVPKGTKKKLQESCLSHVFCLRLSARSAGDIGVSIEVSCVKN